MLATNSSPTPSCQFVPVTKNMRLAARAPTHAKPPSRAVGWALRSAIPPTKMRKTADTIVVAVTVNEARDPGTIPTPRTFRVVAQVWPSGSPGQAALVAIEVR